MKAATRMSCQTVGAALPSPALRNSTSAFLGVPAVPARKRHVSLGARFARLVVTTARAAGGGGGKPSQKRRKKNAKLLIAEFDKVQKDSRKELEEKVKSFDEVLIKVRSGAGGDGEMVMQRKPRMVRNFKYKPGGNASKMIELPPGDPTCGGDGGDVIFYCEPAMDSLMQLHGLSEVLCAKNGSKGDPAQSLSPNSKGDSARMSKAESLRIPVPPGTAIKKKRGGTLLAELNVAGQQLRVVRGGRGGMGVQAPSQQANRRRKEKQMQQEEEGIAVVDDIDWKADAKGMPGEEMSLRLVMRVVADIGLVGLPNAGKSSILTALTSATPEVAPYPFTTLVPNLGVLRSGNKDQAADEDIDWEKITDDQLKALSAFGGAGAQKAEGAVLADLPGLIEGAHKGKGLGRVFLRHLRRSRALLHVVDAATADPVGDYITVRDELRMYNPEYTQRPHVVALNKMDYFAPDFSEALEHGEEIAGRLREAAEAAGSPPAAVVCISAQERLGLDALLDAMKPLMDAPNKSRR